MSVFSTNSGIAAFYRGGRRFGGRRCGESADDFPQRPLGFAEGKLEPGERIEDCAVREVSEECGLRIEELQRKEPITHTFHCYRIREQWVLKRTAWYHMRYVGGQRPQPQTVEGITRAEWIAPERVPELLSGTYYTIGDVFREAGYPVR